MSHLHGNVRFQCLSALAALFAAAGCATAPRAPAAVGPPGSERRVFGVPGHGALEIPVPKGWSAELGQPDPSAVPTIRLEEPGGAFVALLTPFFNPSDPEGRPAPGDTAQLFADLARRNALANAVESEIPLRRLGAGGAPGFWFSATDRALEGKDPGPEEWSHVIQGAAEVGELVLAFTLLDNADGPQRRTLLEVVRAARHVNGSEAEHASDEGMEPDPQARTVPLRVEIRGKPWAVLVDLPGFRMFKPRRSDEGTGVLVLGQDPRSGMVASVIIRPARGAEGAAGCRDADLPKIRSAAVALENLELSSSGAAALASYALGAPGEETVRQEHGHAWLERDGICANVHVSQMAPAPADVDQIERILASVRFGEDM